MRAGSFVASPMFSTRITESNAFFSTVNEMFLCELDGYGPLVGGNFRLLNRLLTQMERILEVNFLREVTKAVVEAGRESLVIGQA